MNKALPYVIAWFEKAEEAVAGEEEWSYNIEERKLSAIYQFAQAMPLLFVPASSCIKGVVKTNQPTTLWRVEDKNKHHV